MKYLSPIMLPILALIFQAACSYTTPPEKFPSPTDQATDKAFFQKMESRSFLQNKQTGFEVSVAEAEHKPEFKKLYHAQSGGLFTLSGQGRAAGAWKIITRNVLVPKTFVCGWAPISEVGYISEWTQVHGAHLLPACNIQFDIEETELVGKQVTPGVPRKDWPTLITVPINSHFDFVRSTDKYNRPKNEWVHRTDRHSWEARTSMSVNWRELSVHDWAYRLLYGGTLTVSVNDFERTLYKGKSYIAFTSSVSSSYFGAHHQAQFRFNFLEFDSDTTFEKRLSHQDNSNHFGTLWGLGSKLNGIHQIKYLARWDFRESVIPHEICLNGFAGSLEAREIAIETLEQWNEALVEAEVVPRGKKAFVVSSQEMNHLFDLRCSSISYVSDKRISARSPLGIAQAQMDVKTGKILWAGSTNYGGALEEWVEHYRGSNFGTGDAFMHMPSEAGYSEEYNRPILGGNPFGHMVSPVDITSMPFREGSANVFNVEDTIKSLYRGKHLIAHKGYDGFIQDLQQFEGLDEQGIDAMIRDGRFAEMAKKFYANGSTNPTAHSWEFLGKKLATMIAEVRGDTMMPGNRFLLKDESLLYGKAIGVCIAEVNAMSTDSSSMLDGEKWHSWMLGAHAYREDQLMRSVMLGRDYGDMAPGLQTAHRNQKVEQNLKRMHNTGVVDLDHTIGRFAMQAAAAPAELQDDIDVEDLVKTSLKKTMLHEFGHMLGLGHNFKDNIMPIKGSIPDAHWDALEKDRKKQNTVNLNFTTIMGYPHAYQVMARRPEEVKIGEQDKLVLRFIYNNQIPIYNGKDVDFEYVRLVDEIPVGRDGRIPGKDEDLGRYSPSLKGYKVSYFPSCTDMMAMLALDPYCNRWDMGWDATSIVKSYFDDYKNNWLSKLNNFAKVRNNLWLVRYYLWRGSLRTFSRVRIFYDYMRREYRDEILKIAENDPKNLLSFSKCANKDQDKNIVRTVIQSADPEFEELCNLNREIVKELGSFITDPGNDFSVFDDSDWSVPTNEWGSGFEDWSRVWGTWKEVGVLPIKMSALFALTTAQSFFTYGHYVIPNYKYSKSGMNNKYVYASLYPEEFTKNITSSVLSNIKLNKDTGNEPKMGRIALFMGSFLMQTFGYPFQSTNDFHEFDGDYMENIKQQSQFIFNARYPFVPVFVRIKRPNGGGKDPEKISNFIAFIYEWGQEIKELGNAYMLPEGKVFFGTTAETFVYPISNLIFLSDNIALAWGIRVQYNKSDYSALWVEGIKHNLFTTYEDIGTTCREKAGLSSYFSTSNKKFGGFYIPYGIAGNDTRYREFTDSVRKQFDKYLEEPGYSENGTVCTKALDDVGLVVSQALALNNIFLPMVFRYMVH